MTRPTFSLDSSERKVAEGNFLYFAVLREGDTSLTESVFVSTSSGSAKEGIDFDPIGNRRLIFLPGVRQVNQRIKIHKDQTPEFTESFRIQLLEDRLFGTHSSLGEPNITTVHVLDIDT
jgi:Calx-beta domain